jgi:hypothetical protein
VITPPPKATQIIRHSQGRDYALPDLYFAGAILVLGDKYGHQAQAARRNTGDAVLYAKPLRSLAGGLVE